MSDVRTPTRYFPRGRKIWVPAILFVLVGAWALAFLPAILLAHWVPGSTVEEQGKLLASAGQIVLFGLGGIIAVIGVALSIARHGQSLLDAEDLREREHNRRDEFRAQLDAEGKREASRAREAALQHTTSIERDLRARFAGAVELLSAESPVKRTAGMYALATLGNDWLAFGKPNELQVCIDVMCGYLRAATAADERTSEEASVRQTGYDLIRDHLRANEHGSRPAWEGRNFPLMRAPMWFSVNLEGIGVSNGTTVDLTGFQIGAVDRVALERVSVGADGRLLLRGGTITSMASIWFDDAEIVDGGLLDMRGVTVTNNASIIAPRLRVQRKGSVELGRSHVSTSASIDFGFGVLESGGSIDAHGMKLDGQARMHLGRIQLGDAAVLSLRAAMVGEKSAIDCIEATVSGGLIDASRIHVQHDARVWFEKSRLARPQSLNLAGARIEDYGVVDVSEAFIGESALRFPAGNLSSREGGVQPSSAEVLLDRFSGIDDDTA